MAEIDLIITCADKRLHNERGYHVKGDAEQIFELPNTYLVTVPGPDHRDRRLAVMDAIKTFAGVGTLKTVTIVSHEQCAGHPCDNATHVEDTLKFANEVREQHPDTVVKTGFAHRIHDDEWRVEEIGA